MISRRFLGMLGGMLHEMRELVAMFVPVRFFGVSRKMDMGMDDLRQGGIFVVVGMQEQRGGQREQAIHDGQPEQERAVAAAK